MSARKSLEARLKHLFLSDLAVDPTREAEIDRILAALAVNLFYLTTGLMLISLLLDLWIRQSVSFGTVALLGVQQFSAWYVLLRVRRTGLLARRVETPDEYRLALARLRRTAALSGLVWGVLMLLLMNVGLPLLTGEPVRMAWFQLLIWLLGGAAFGLGMYLWQKRRLVLGYELQRSAGR